MLNKIVICAAIAGLVFGSVQGRDDQNGLSSGSMVREFKSAITHVTVGAGAGGIVCVVGGITYLLLSSDCEHMGRADSSWSPALVFVLEYGLDVLIVGGLGVVGLLGGATIGGVYWAVYCLGKAT